MIWPPEITHWFALLSEQLRTSGDSSRLAIDILMSDGNAPPPSAWPQQLGAVTSAALLASDPTLYMLAMLACTRVAEAKKLSANGCDQLSFDYLLQLAPNNALLWMTMAAGARARADRGAELDALYHASVATQYEWPTKAATRIFFSSLPDEAPVWVKYALAERLARRTGIASGRGEIQAAVSMTESCTEASLADSNTRALCDTLATNLLEKSTSPDTLWSGVIVGQQLHWNADRLGPFEHDASLLYRAKKLLPTPPEAACGEASTGLTTLGVLAGINPLPLLRTDEIQAEMLKKADRRRASETTESSPNAEDDDAPL